MIHDVTPGAMAVILGMAAVTIFLRWMGYFLMAHVRLGPRLEAGFRTLPGAVAAALFVPVVLADGVTAFAAVVVAAVIARLGRGDTVTLAAGIAVAVAMRHLGL
jgi:uncharacterized membrane protein